MKIQSLSLLAAAALACAACKNNAETSAATTDASASAPASEQAPTAEAPAAGSATTAEATTATAPATDAATAAAPAASGGWSYEGSDGAKRTASVSGRGLDGGAQLVFADDPVWGRTAYVEFAQDGIDCPTGCKAQISVDGGAAKTVQASRPETPQPRLSLREPDKLWQSIANAKTLSIEFPAKSGTGKVEFDVAGVDTSKLPAGWN